MPPAPLSKQQIDDFHADGYLFPVPVLSPAEADETLARVARYKEAALTAGGDVGEYWFHPKIHLLATWADRLVRDERLVGIAEQLIGPDILVWSTSVFERAAGSGDSIEWHQDAPYYGWEGFEGATVRLWLALTPTSRENGTMRYAPLTHLQGLVAHEFTGTTLQDMRRGERAGIDVDEGVAADVVLDRGHCALHLPTTVHCSGPSSSEQPRVCFAVDYIAPTVVPRHGPDSAMLVRGRDAVGHYRPEEPPRTDFGTEEVERFRRASADRFTRLGKVAREVRSAAGGAV